MTLGMEILEGLNPAQKQAVETIDGPLLIIAGPGSGKTRVITHRIAYMVRVRDVLPYRIAAVTFTNKAAREMKDRLERLVGPHSDALTVGTFHSFCAQMLRRDGSHVGLSPSYTIFDSDDQLALIKQAMELADIDAKQFPPQAVRSTISKAKSILVDAQTFARNQQNYFEERCARIYHHYEELLARNNAADFDDLLMRAVQLLQDNQEVRERYQERYHYLMVDEFQDTNVAQYRLARLLAEERHNICVVGDPDQSIYSWRSADIRNILSFQNDYADAATISLEQNYRSTGKILEAAKQLISANGIRLNKDLFTDNDQGKPVTIHEAYDEGEEASFVIDEIARLVREEKMERGDCAVMYRVNAQSRALEEACLHRGMKYRLVGGVRFYQRREVKDLMCYLRLLVNPNDDNAFLRIINTPRREIGPATLDKLATWALKRGQGLYHVCDDFALSEVMNPKAAEKLQKFKAWLDAKRQFCFGQNSLQAVQELITDMDYEGWLMQNASSPRIGEKNIENIWQLVRSIERMLEKQEDEEEGASDLESVIKKLVLLDMLEQQQEEDDSDRVQLMTLHASKGLEFPHVYMMGVEEEFLPHRTSIEEDNIVEERRLMYVGITRARETLAMTQALTRKQYGEKIDTTASRFVDEMPQEDIDYLGIGIQKDEAKEDAVAEASIANLRALLD